MNRSNRFLGFCPKDEKGKAFRADIKAILKRTGFRCVYKEIWIPFSLKGWTKCRFLAHSLYLRPCRGGSFCPTISKYEAEILVVGMVLAVRKIHHLHGNDLSCK
jgi:hypothetical protein